METNNSEPLVVLQSYDNQLSAEIAKSMLDCAGIFCALEGEYMSQIYTIGAFPIRLVVRAEDLVEARQILENR